jgi:C-terminal processing protease CtpA/Prc
MRYSHTLLGAFALAVVALPAGAQSARSEDKSDSETIVYRSSGDDDERAMLGVSTSSAGERDTLGLFVSAVTPGGPAEKAGIEEGHRIAAINGVSLRLAAADAGEDDMQGIMSRRLTREMRKLKAGDEVSLRVYADGRFRDVKVKTIAAEDMPNRRVRVSRSDMEDRPVLGLSVHSTGSRRDTLGIMVQSVAEEGPAEKAGIYEGDRIAAINGVDLRVSREDAGDDWVGNARSNRFSRELGKVKVGDDVELRVYSNGQFRTVRVKAARRGDVYKEEGRRMGFFFGDEGGFGAFGRIAPMPPMPPMAPMAPMAPRVRIFRAPQIFELENDARDDAERAARSATRAARDAERAAQRDAERARRAVRGQGLIQAGYTPSATPMVGFASYAPAVAPAIARAGTSSSLVLPGLRASRMDRDLAAYFSDDASVGDGLLVIEVDDRWEGLRVGDVIVAVNGKRVRGNSAKDVCLDRSQANTVEVVRRGKRQTVRLPAA